MFFNSINDLILIDNPSSLTESKSKIKSAIINFCLVSYSLLLYKFNRVDIEFSKKLDFIGSNHSNEYLCKNSPLSRINLRCSNYSIVKLFEFNKDWNSR